LLMIRELARNKKTLSWIGSSHLVRMSVCWNGKDQNCYGHIDIPCREMEREKS
jgi:hypothetical protein